MAYASSPYSEGAYAGGVIPNTAPPGQQLPPPVPGATISYTWAIQPGVRPYGVGSYAGGSAPAPFTGGGIVIAPNSDAGTMTASVWWPDATQLQVIRVHPDGSRVPVRGAYPLSVADATRRNACTNPSVETGLNGYVPADGNPTLTSIAL